MKIATESTIKSMSPQLIVSDIDRSIGFYVNELGFRLDFRHEDFYAGVSRDGFSVHLKSGIPLKEERMKKRHHEDLDIVFGVENVDQLFQQFSRPSVEILQPLCDRPYGREFYIADPDGYILAFLENQS